MSKERAFLKKLRYASLLENDLRKELEELLAQPEQDPEVLKKDWVNFGYEAGRKSALSKQEPLTPRQGLEEYKRGYARAELDLKREPLSDEEVRAKYRDIALDNPLYVPSYYAGFRDAERTHGIGGEE